MGSGAREHLVFCQHIWDHFDLEGGIHLCGGGEVSGLGSLHCTEEPGQGQ